MICDKSELVFEVLHNDFEETPQWYGKDVNNGTTYVLTANLKDSTWTLIQMDKDIACVMGIGTDPKSLIGKPV